MAVRPTALGTQLVVHALGQRPDLDAHEPGSPAANLVHLLGEAEERVNGLQEQLVSAARFAAERLLRVAEGQDHVHHGSPDGILQYGGVQIDMLSARRGDAVRNLRALLAVYQAITSEEPQRIAPPTVAKPAAKSGRTTGARRR
ncbi:hypothetical protein ACQPZG_31885 [Streptomyces sp. CA-294286]|uniref:hypothetical protein n=1 Tax=Streptomyces sp. CA-294286 TaxID=3240070 RepID=UPI003D91726B